MDEHGIHPRPLGARSIGDEIVDIAEPSFRDLEQRAAAAERRPTFGTGSQIICDNLVKIYKVADLEVVALQGLDLLVERGELMAVVGASGSGKSTLLHILGGLDVPSAGRAVVAGHDLGAMKERERVHYRRHVVGFIRQQTALNLLPYLTAAENVELPMILAGTPPRTRGQRTAELLATVGLADRARHRPDALSGGEQQRVSIAVALANLPEVILADEPTGELDTATSHEIFNVLRQVVDEMGVTVVVVTHDPLVSGQVRRTVGIRDGRTSSETLRRTERGDDGDHRVISEEFAVLDRAGRLQLPREHVDALRLERRVRLRLQPDHIGVWPDRSARDGGAPRDATTDSEPGGTREHGEGQS
jgi:ABC-type lipoprotein export system ATPase subunit